MTTFGKYIVYVDESGNSNWKAAPEFPILCVNYCLFRKDYYLDELVPRFNRLKFDFWGSDNIVLHERDLRKSEKVADPALKSKLEMLRGEKRIAFMEQMTMLLSDAEFNCFCVIIDKPKVPDRYKSFDPYHISLSRGFRQIEAFLSRNDPDELDKELHFVFEKRGREEDESLSRAYQQILLQGSLLKEVPKYRFSNFRLELMDKKSNSTGLQVADLTARPIGNHYLHATSQRTLTDQRVANIILNKLTYVTDSEVHAGRYDVFHDNL